MLGGYAERVAVPASYVMRLPATLPLDVGAAFPVVALTAYHLLRSAYRVHRGEIVLVHSIGGAVGLLVTQIATAFGATVIGTVGTAGKGDRARAYGARLVIDRSRDDFVAAARAFTHGRGVDLVIDSLGADVLPRSFDALRPSGGSSTSGKPPDTRTSRSARSSTSAPQRWPDSSCSMPALARRGGGRACASCWTPWPPAAWRSRSRARYPLAEVTEMHRRLETRGVSGKLLLELTRSG